MNTETRDHLNFLKGALDLLTNSTTADTGATMLLDLNRASGSDVFRSRVTADTQARLRIASTGLVGFGSGAATQDLYVYRSQVNRLIIDRDGAAGGQFIFATSTATGGEHFFSVGDAYIYFTEGPDPPVAGLNEARLFCRDNGAGKTQLAAIFNTGAVQVIATQP